MGNSISIHFDKLIWFSSIFNHKVPPATCTASINLFTSLSDFQSLSPSISCVNFQQSNDYIFFEIIVSTSYSNYLTNSLNIWKKKNCSYFYGAEHSFTFNVRHIHSITGCRLWFYYYRWVVRTNEWNNYYYELVTMQQQTTIELVPSDGVILFCFATGCWKKKTSATLTSSIGGLQLSPAHRNETKQKKMEINKIQHTVSHRGVIDECRSQMNTHTSRSE